MLEITVVIESRTDKILRFSFHGVNSAIYGMLDTHELNVWVEWENDWWDIILSLDSAPTRAPNGFLCTRCRNYFLDKNPGKQFDEIYETRELIWEKDIFEPFREWINNDLEGVMHSA